MGRKSSAKNYSKYEIITLYCNNNNNENNNDNENNYSNNNDN